MRYYITADIHSYYDELIAALTEKGKLHCYRGEFVKMKKMS